MQYHVYAMPDGTLVCDLQTDLIDIGSRVVAPLIPVSEGLQPISRLEPVFEIEGRTLALHTAELAAIPARLVQGPPVADLSHADYAIKGALDMVFSGF
ncbi:MAG: CcdB family protein [Pseudooceanicola sp.]